MKIDHVLIEETLGLRSDRPFQSEGLGLTATRGGSFVSFLDSERFLQQADENSAIRALFVSAELAERISRGDVARIVCDDPRYYFYTLLNELGAKHYRRNENRICPSAHVHPSAVIAGHNVSIGANTVIAPHVTIYPDVTIGEECFIGAGTVIGSQGFEYKRTSKGVLTVRHDGFVEIGNKVDTGANCALDLGFSYRPTTVDDECKLDNFVHIAHGVQVGKRTFFAAKAMIAGSTTIGSDVWVGPSVTVSNQLTVGSRASLRIGALVLKDVPEDGVVMPRR